MNVIYLSISPMKNISGHGISLDLIHEFVRHGHNMFVVCGLERKTNQDTNLTEEAGCKVLRVRIGNNKKANIIEKGLTTITLPRRYIAAIKKYFPDVKFDLVLYPTPPITHVKTVEFIKKRDHARSYLLLKDIFPQNAVDIGMMEKGLLYRYFRKQEKKLYAISDNIGCMSQANVDYLLKHNPEVNPGKVEICPNAIEVTDKSITEEQRTKIRKKYGIPLDKKVFVYGGNLGKPQGIPFIIQCLRECKDLTDAFFLIVGDGTEFGKLNEFITNEQPANTTLMRRLPKEDYDTLVAACDVGLIFLDHRFTIPNFPSRLLGYMQAKVPVFACTDEISDVGKTIVAGGYGWWCKSNQSKTFKHMVQSVIAEIHQINREAEFAYLHDHFSVSLNYERIIRKYTNREEKG